MRKVLLVITGPVCSGKTRLGRALAKNLGAAVLRTEDFHRPYLRKLRTSLEKAFEDFCGGVAAALSANQILIVEGMFLSPERRTRLWELATGAGAALLVVTLKVGRATLERRYKQEREGIGYRGFDAAHALRMADRFAENPWGVVLDTSGSSFAAAVRSIIGVCKEAQSGTESQVRMYFDNTALQLFLELLEGVVPPWGTESSLR